ncbi:MAG: hypothetical protein IPK37_14720 [Austwickia sp.]|jgi:hypothetical protein|nr:MAG: hypothetical protein IPK37_14720 [Austwickia sp.]
MGWAELFGGGSGTSGAAVADLRRRVATLEAQVDALAHASGVDLTRLPVPAVVSPRVRQLALRARRSRRSRSTEETGLGLAEAKADVDGITR